MSWLDKLRVLSIRKQADRGGVVLDQNSGFLNTGKFTGTVVICNGHTYPANLQIPHIDDPEPTVEGLLGWRSRTPRQLVGREADKQRLLDWAKADAKVRFCVLHGEGGAGKSRLAFELAETLRAEGWEAGLTGSSSHIAYRLSEAGTLLIVDYPEQQPQQIEKLAQWLANHEAPDTRLRILLLCRQPEHMEALLRSAHAGDKLSPSLALAPLPHAAQAWQLFQAGWAEMAALRHKRKGIPTPPTLPIDAADFDTWLQRDPAQHGKPLIVLAYALNLLDDPKATALKREEILGALVAREGDRIKHECQTHGLDGEAVLLLKALAALPGQLDARQIDALAATLKAPGLTLPSALALKRTSLLRQGVLAELQPDLLAASLLHRQMAHALSDPSCCANWLWQVLALDANDDNIWRERLSRLARLSVDRPTAQGPDPLIAAMASALPTHPEYITPVANALARDTIEWPLCPLAIAAAQHQLNRVEVGSAEEAGLLNNLSNYLANTGQQNEALQAIQRALEIYDELAKQNFATYAPALAASLNNLSNRLVEGGQHRKALQAIQRAVDIYDELTEQNFATYTPDLAMSLNNLSNSLADAGHYQEALQANQRALEIYEGLVKQNYTACTPGLASSLNNRSNRLANAGQHKEALQASLRALEIYDELAVQNFAAYAPCLATNLNNLSNRLAENDQHQEALQACQRAVQIHNELAEQNFAAYAPNLARSLNNLSARLANAGQHQDALQAIQRAVEIHEGLAEQNPAAHAPDLARSLGRRAELLREVAPDEARKHAARGIAVLQPFARPGTPFADLLEALKTTLASIPGGQTA